MYVVSYNIADHTYAVQYSFKCQEPHLIVKPAFVLFSFRSVFENRDCVENCH